MANAFDQFDETPPPSGPVKITVPGGAKSTSNGTVQGNPFDQFDAPAPPPKEDLGSAAGRVAANLGIGALEGIVSLPETPGALLDLVPAAAGMRSLGTQDEPAPGVDLAAQDRAFAGFMADKYGPANPNLPNGYSDDIRKKAWQEFIAAGGAPAPRAPQKSAGTALNETIRTGLKGVGLDLRSYFDPDTYFQPPKDDLESYSRTAGAMGVGMLLPGEWANEATTLSKLGKAGREFTTGAVGGMAGQKAAEGATNDQDRMAINALTMLGTGMAARGAGAVAKKVGSQFGKTGDYLAPALPWSDKRKIAAKQLADLVEDRPQTISALESAPEFVPGSKPTAAKASGDTNIASFERALARNDDTFNAQLLARQEENSAARVAQLQDVADQGAPTAAADYFQARMRELEERANALYDQHAQLADKDTAALGDTPSAGEIGQRARTALQGNFKRLNDETNALWKALPDDMVVPTGPITAVRDRIYGEMTPEDRLSLQPIEGQIQSLVDDYGTELSFDRFKRLRSALTTAMREMKIAGKGPAYGRLSQMLDGVEEAMGQSINERAAQDQQAVAAGRLAPENALANRFLNDAQQFDNQQAGVGAATGNATPEAAPTTAVPRDTGAARPVERGPARTPGAERFPPDALQRPVEGSSAALRGAPSSVFNRLLDAFASAGRPDEEASHTAAVATAMYSAFAKMHGMTPEELLSDYPIEVRKSAEAPGGSLAQSATEAVAQTAKPDPLAGLDKASFAEPQKPSNSTEAALALPDLAKQVVGYSAQYAPAIEFAKAFKEHNFLNGGKETLATALKKPEAMEMAQKMLDKSGWTKTQIVDNGGLLGAVEFEMNYAYGQLAADYFQAHGQMAAAAKAKAKTDTLYEELKSLVGTPPKHPLLNPKNVITDAKIADVSGYSSGMTAEIGGKADIAREILNNAIKEAGWPETPITADGVILQIDNTRQLYDEAKNWLHERGITDDMIDEVGGTGSAFASAMMALHEKGTAILAKIEADVAAEKKKAQSFTEYASGKQINPFDPNFDKYQSIASMKPRGVLSQEFYDRVRANPNFQSFMEDGGIEKYNRETGKKEPLVVYHGAPNHGFRYFSGDTFFAADPSTSASYGGSALYKHITPEEVLSDPKEMASIFGPDAKVVQQGGYGKKIPYRVTWRDPYSEKTSHQDFPDRRALLRHIDKSLGDRIPRYGSSMGRAATAPFFIRMENPYEVDFGGNSWSDAPPGDHNDWMDATKTEYEVYFDHDHVGTFDDKDAARERLDELISEAADERAQEHRSEIQQKFSIIAPTPLFGDETYVVRFEPKAGDNYFSLDHGQEWEASDLSSVQQFIEDAIDDEEMGARDYFEERLHENSYVDENESGSMSTDSIVEWAKYAGYDGVIFRNIEDGGPETDVFVTTRPEQVKSPFNIGSFDPDDPHFLFQTAYHSSPHNFSKFELSPRTIRSREGNLDFGHGLYFSTSDQARSYYRATVAGRDGHEYTVDLPENDELIHWDTPVSQQSSYIQSALNRLPPQYRPTPEMRGGDAYRKIADRLGDEAASRKLKDIGIAGHRYRDAGSRGAMPENKRTYNFVIYDDSRISILDKSPVDEMAQGQQRGAIELGDTSAIIHMLKNADASTGVHELSHQFLRMYRDLAERPHGPLPIRQDFATIRDWWHKNASAVAKDSGNKNVTTADVRAAIINGTSGDIEIDRAIDRGMQEQWARAFEKYLGEGVAPTAALAQVFARFKQWLLDVYKSLTGLNVDLSPEMRGVFDRMLGGDTEPTKPAQKIGAAEAAQYAKARGATKELKETFSPAPVKAILNRAGAGYAYKMPDESVAGKLWRAGPDGGGQVKQIIAAAGNTPEIKQAVTDAAVTSLKSKAMKNGRLDPELLSKWRTAHAAALEAVPNLSPKLNSVDAAERALAEIGRKRAAAIESVQKSAIGKLLKVGADADVVHTLGAMLGKQDAVKSMRELMAQASKDDPDAVAGLQSALAQHMMERLASTRGGFKPDTYQRYLGKNAPALAQVFSPEQMANFRAIAQDLKREQKDVRAPGGGSDTAQNLAAARRFGLEKPTLLGKIWSLFGVPAATAAATAIGMSPTNWMMQSIGAIGAAIGTHAVQQAREAGMEKVRDFIRAAMLDPKLMAELLKIAPGKPNAGSHLSLATYLVKLGTLGALQAERQQRRKEKPAFADGGTVATMDGDVYTSPPAWAAPIVAKLINDANNGGKIAGVIPNQPSGVI